MQYLMRQILGLGHAEQSIVDWAVKNGYTLNAVRASRPICSSCEAAIKNAGDLWYGHSKETSEMNKMGHFEREAPEILAWGRQLSPFIRKKAALIAARHAIALSNVAESCSFLFYGAISENKDEIEFHQKKLLETQADFDTKYFYLEEKNDPELYKWFSKARAIEAFRAALMAEDSVFFGDCIYYAQESLCTFDCPEQGVENYIESRIGLRRIAAELKKNDIVAAVLA